MLLNQMKLIHCRYGQLQARWSERRSRPEPGPWDATVQFTPRGPHETKTQVLLHESMAEMEGKEEISIQNDSSDHQSCLCDDTGKVACYTKLHA